VHPDKEQLLGNRVEGKTLNNSRYRGDPDTNKTTKRTLLGNL
jgi:hypothetical protein